jgi:hypothetical protein
MATKNLGEFATPNDNSLRAPIAQPTVTVQNYEIKSKLLNLVMHLTLLGKNLQHTKQGYHLRTPAVTRDGNGLSLVVFFPEFKKGAGSRLRSRIW